MQAVRKVLLVVWRVHDHRETTTPQVTGAWPLRMLLPVQNCSGKAGKVTLTFCKTTHPPHVMAHSIKLPPPLLQHPIWNHMQMHPPLFTVLLYRHCPLTRLIRIQIPPNLTHIILDTPHQICCVDWTSAWDVAPHSILYMIRYSGFVRCSCGWQIKWQDLDGECCFTSEHVVQYLNLEFGIPNWSGMRSSSIVSYPNAFIVSSKTCLVLDVYSSPRPRHNITKLW